uniref:Uncharacterized protein n=1 Tax=Arundo donax TaxID=35708 RepID=A0A0A8YJM5_ARUDO
MNIFNGVCPFCVHARYYSAIQRKMQYTLFDWKDYSASNHVLQLNLGK